MKKFKNAEELRQIIRDLKKETSQYMNTDVDEIIPFSRMDNGEEFWYYKHHPGHIIGDLNLKED